MRTTLTLDDDIAAKVKAEVRRSGRSFKEIVNEFLRLGLNVRKQNKPSKRFVVTTRRLNPRPGLNFDNIGELLEQLEGTTHK